MSSVDQVFDSVGLILVVTEVVNIRYIGTGRRRREVRNVETQVKFGTGFIVDGNFENGQLRNSNSSDTPIVVSVAHLIPTSGTSRYYLKLFDNSSKISKIHELSLEVYNRSIDICVFKFLSVPSVQCLQWNTGAQKSGDVCYLAGYPLGDSQLSIVKGSIRDPTYCFTDLGSGIDQLYHSAPATRGNSGSCVLDGSSNIIGIHAWGYADGLTSGYENFTGGPSTHSAFKIISYMVQNTNLALNKYFPRVQLCIYAKILDDLFRIQNLTNSNLNNVDGLIITGIPNSIANYTVNAHNLRAGTTKIAVNDLITSIFDNSKSEYIPVGYSRESPLNILFTHPLNTPIKIKIRKAPVYNVEYEITLENPYKSIVSQDAFYSNFI